MVGSVDWAESPFNRAVLGRVQPGSLAKLPLVVAACEAGLSPNSIVIDEPQASGWPSNGAEGYAGRTTIETVVAESRNAGAVRLAQSVGPAKVAAASRRLGLDPGNTPDAGIVLGPYSTNVMQMTAAYAAVANGGYRVRPVGALAVIDGSGGVLSATDYHSNSERVVEKRCVPQLRRMLAAVVSRGTGRRAKPLHGTAFGKTGTSTGSNDAWFVGWSGPRVLGIWLGKGRRESATELFGGGLPAELFARTIDAANGDARPRRHGLFKVSALQSPAQARP